MHRIARALSADASQAGWAGLKDRHAVTTQWASFFRADAERARALELESIRILDARPHPHKLRTGHLRGNRFGIRIRGTQPDAEVARTILDALVARGTPNYYGEQRFGRDRDNAARARAFLSGEERPPRDRFERKLLASALQASWFNAWLADRVRTSRLGQAIAGDLMRKEDTGGMFVAEDVSEAQGRVDRWEISPTGPMYGVQMRWPASEALRIEQELWERCALPGPALQRFGSLLPGTRRVARVRPADVSIAASDAGLELEFTLPRGAYATVVLRELLKPEASEASPPHDEDVQEEAGD